MDVSYQIMAIVSALAFSAFFSGIETAFLAADRLHMKLYGERKTLSARILGSFFGRPDRFICTTLVGNTIALVVYGAGMTAVLDPMLRIYLPASVHSKLLLLISQTLLSTLSILVVAEFIPKSLFLLGPNRWLTLLALPTAAVSYVLRPLVVVTTSIARLFIVHVLGQKYQETHPVFGLTDLRRFIETSLNRNQQLPIGVSARIVGNLLEFRKVKVRDCMVPRKEIVAVSMQDGIEGLRQAVIRSDHAKIVIYRNDIDDIVGYCHSKDLFKKPQHIESILIPVMIVPETNLASEVMVRLTTEGKSLALVVDEFGGTSGIVSVEDIVGEIIGEIKGEHEIGALLAQKLQEDTYLLSARHEIDDLNEKYGWQIPAGDYDTLGGFILATTESIPALQATVHIAPFTFTILSIKDTHIDTVKVVVNNSAMEE